ncbi:MAG TPA: hypothetical protein PKD64_16040 [Pirellulaceae bacterium]|nr:hypothetical protein [Pirellulaceae bacterium]HMO93699.1 hypothetical protein [Pirellulaceae bacterium]HMP70961.1 hypothetical protein [Pirellulaceae bacterium]
MKLIRRLIGSFVVCFMVSGEVLESQAAMMHQDGKQEQTNKTDQDDANKQDSDQENEDVDVIELAGGALKLAAPKSWTKKVPRFNMIEAEYAMNLEGDQAGKLEDGRLTIMQSGGGVEGNIQRWYGQFEQKDGSSTEDVAKVEELEIDGLPVHWIDISGSYKGGPGSTGEVSENFRMLGAIIETKKNGDYYLKFYGPAEIIEVHYDRFKSFVKSLQAKE